MNFSLPFNNDGAPKPLILVGRNGSGKSIMLSIFINALALFAQTAYDDILKGRDGNRIPLFRMHGITNQRIDSKFAVALLRFDSYNKSFYFAEKTGILEYSSYIKLLPEEFSKMRGIKPWEISENYVKFTEEKKEFQKIFKESSICFFPPSRKEMPHWLNTSSVGIESRLVPLDDIKGNLRKPIFIESSGEENRRWLLDVFLDSLVDAELLEADYDAGHPDVQLNEDDTRLYCDKIDVKEKILLKQSLKNIETVLKNILENKNVVLKLNKRNHQQFRLCISDESKILVPSLDHLSAGQSILFNLFVTIIRYSDMGDINKSTKLDEIRGIVVIDEIDLHLHTDLQHDVLPYLISLFPHVQFIITTHSPIFLLGMKKLYGEDGFEIIEMPTGKTIPIEQFSEFQKSFDHYSETKKFEEGMRIRIVERTRPLLLTEGETDPKFIKAGIEALGRKDLLESIDIEWVGKKIEQGLINSGINGLNNTRQVLVANPNILKHRLLLLYDCDANKPSENIGLLSIRTTPKNEKNTRIKKGIENLFPIELFLDSFYEEETKVNDYGTETSIKRFNKTKFCRWACNEGKNEENFRGFSVIIEILDDIIKIESTKSV